MHRGCAIILCLALGVAACGGPAPERDTAAGTESASPLGSTASTIAGRTLSCNAGGPPSNLTFAPDGTISGRLLQTDVTGTWYVNEKREVHTHIMAGAISLRDNLRQVGNRWVGKTTTCAG